MPKPSDYYILVTGKNYSEEFEKNVGKRLYRYEVSLKTDRSNLHEIVFKTDSREELRVWLDCAGLLFDYRASEMLYNDSFSVGNTFCKVSKHGFCGGKCSAYSFIRLLSAA